MINHCIISWILPVSPLDPPQQQRPQPTKNRGFSRKDLRLLGLVASIDPDRDGVKDLTG